MILLTRNITSYSMDTKKLIEMLREKGVKVTPQRLAIYENILANKEHLTVDQIYQEVQKKFPTLSLTTVYHTLHLLTKIELLQELRCNNGISRYEPNKTPHINIICQNCGAISDYQSKNVENFLLQLKKELKTKLLGNHFEIQIICEKCRKQGLR